jgi:pimeloyl-ACP methyl ester carboxylesterase
LAGYGDSSDPRFDDFSTMVDVTAACLMQLFGSDTPFDLAGFSFGGLVSANLAAKGLSVRRLALLGPGGHGGPRRERGKLVNWKRAETYEDLLEAMRFNLWAHMIYADTHIDDFAMGIHTYSCINTRFRSRGISGRGLLGPALDLYNGETLIIWGEHDITCTPEYLMTQMIDGHARRQGLILSGVGHWVNYEAIEPVNILLKDWFKAGKIAHTV